MTAVPRDPIFWKRFSTAVHLDAGKIYSNSDSSPSKVPDDKYVIPSLLPESCMADCRCDL